MVGVHHFLAHLAVHGAQRLGEVEVGGVFPIGGLRMVGVSFEHVDDALKVLHVLQFFHRPHHVVDLLEVLLGGRADGGSTLPLSSLSLLLLSASVARE